jgi:lysophospholipase L1-like esterase
MTPALRAVLLAQPMTPARLFGRGDQGAWYDPNDLSTLFQDTAGAVPVTAAGQTVKRVNDKSGRGNHATNATGWLLLSDGPLYYLQMDGATTFTTSAFAWGSDKLTLWAGTTGSGAATTVSFGTVGTQTGTFDFGYYEGGALLYHRGSGTFGARGTASVGALPVVASVQCDLAGSTHTAECPALQVDGVQGSLTNYGQADSGSGNFGTYALKLGGGSSAASGRLYALIAVAKISPLTRIESYIGTKTRAPSSIEALTFDDTGTQASAGTHQLTSPFAHVDFTTTATSLILNSYNDIYSNYPTYTELGVYVDGVFNQRVQPGALGAKANAIALSAGSKTVSIVNGLQSRPSSSVIGTFVTKVTANAVLTPVTPAPANRVLVYGDSISVGGNATVSSQEAWAMIVRAAYYPNSLAVEGWGFRALKNDCADAAARDAFVAKVVAYNPARLWIAIGTNDYGIGGMWSAANFGTAYAALLDDLNAALPSLSIFCQTPILRTTETANTYGSTLGDYRTQIGTAVGTRGSFCTLVDGTAFMTTASLADGVHPTTAGHALYADAVKTALGIA